MGLLSTDIDLLISYFPCKPWQVIETRGTREGLILKFKSFYLKIYNANSENVYLVEGYRYGCNRLLLSDKVDYNKMREYASQFSNII